MFKKLESWVNGWGKDRGITVNGKSMAQAIKTLEETTELLDAINRKDTKAMKDAIGDIVVTLMMTCEIENTSIEECLGLAWEEIKDRKGYLREDGTFIKEV